MAGQRAAAKCITELDQRGTGDVSIKLRRGERCWYSSACTLLDHRKKAKKHRRGQLYVTSARVLFMDERATAIPLAKILDVAADAEAGILRVIKDGRQAPYLFEIDEPLVGLAHTERSVSEL